MNERPKPNLLRRAAITMATVGVIGTAGAIADTEITRNAINEEIHQLASFEQLTKTREEITIFDARTHHLIQQRDRRILRDAYSGIASEALAILGGTLFFLLKSPKRIDENQQKPLQPTNSIT